VEQIKENVEEEVEEQVISSIVQGSGGSDDEDEGDQRCNKMFI
jgi:hypothetical protein